MRANAFDKAFQLGVERNYKNSISESIDAMLDKLWGFLPDAFQSYSDQSKLILCDCNGTLLRGDLSLNKSIVKFLVAAKERGYEVHLVSDRANLLQMVVEDCLSDYGLSSDYFGDVELKSDYAGAKALIILDDDPETMCHVPAKYVLKPDDPRIPKMTARLQKSGVLQMAPAV